MIVAHKPQPSGREHAERSCTKAGFELLETSVLLPDLRGKGRAAALF